MKISIDLKDIPFVFVLLVFVFFVLLLVISFPVFLGVLLLLLFLLFVIVFQEQVEGFFTGLLTKCQIDLPDTNGHHGCCLSAGHAGSHKCFCGETWNGKNKESEEK